MNAAPTSIPVATPTIAAALRRIRLLPRTRRGRLLRGGGGLLGGRRLRARPRLGLHAPQRRLQVVEDEADGRRGACRRRDRQLRIAYDEDAAVTGRDLQLRERRIARPDLLRGGKQVGCGLRERVAGRQRRAGDLA